VQPASPPIDRETIFLARQPILDRKGRVHAYELLYRGSGTDTTCETPAPEEASARVLHGAVMTHGLASLTPGCPAFVNVTRPLLLKEISTLLPPGAVVLEVLETVDVDAEVVDACRRLHGAGYAIALDDFVPGSSAEQLFPLAAYLKVDVLALDHAERARLVRRLPSHLQLIAEKVETPEVFAETVDEGFTLFQGYYFCRPSTFKTRDVPVAHLTSLRLIEALARPNVTLGQLDDLIKRDVSLCQRVLRYVNSAALGLSQPIHSIHHALTLMGIDVVRRWTSVWALAGMSHGKTPEVMTMAVVRARCCERLGTQAVDTEGGGEFFLLGLCSLLDVLLERPMDAVLASLSLPPRTLNALSGHAGPVRSLLDAVIAYERAEWETAAAAATAIGIPAPELAAAYADAVTWAEGLDAKRAS
jgi:c-di-GMP-related signal transduction protein